MLTIGGGLGGETALSRSVASERCLRYASVASVDAKNTKLLYLLGIILFLHARSCVIVGSAAALLSLRSRLSVPRCLSSPVQVYHPLVEQAFRGTTGVRQHAIGLSPTWYPRG
jgi:hypothetical protein